MKSLFLLLIILSSPSVLAGVTSLQGKVISSSPCSKKAMVWLSLDKENYQEKLLLMHTEVPVGGSYQFYVKPGAYQVHGSDEAGCGFFRRVSVKDNETAEVTLRMVKK